ncbi:arginine:ornithine antiporter, partial [Streptococcus agalactiae]|nr:arginine:ornithine antiporter [Streptococcus agalactiae]
IYAVLATAFTLFMIFGAGLRYLLLGAIIWMTGFGFFYQGKKEKGQRLSKVEWLWWGVIAVMALAGILGLLTGTLQIK